MKWKSVRHMLLGSRPPGVDPYAYWFLMAAPPAVMLLSILFGALTFVLVWIFEEDIIRASAQGFSFGILMMLAGTLFRIFNKRMASGLESGRRIRGVARNHAQLRTKHHNCQQHHGVDFWGGWPGGVDGHWRGNSTGGVVRCSGNSGFALPPPREHKMIRSMLAL